MGSHSNITRFLSAPWCELVLSSRTLHTRMPSDSMIGHEPKELEKPQRGLISVPFFFDPPDFLSPPITSPSLLCCLVPNERYAPPPIHSALTPPPPHHLPSPLQFWAINGVVSLASTSTGGARGPHSRLLLKRPRAPPPHLSLHRTS
jgi:hypothetical protein